MKKILLTLFLILPAADSFSAAVKSEVTTGSVASTDLASMTSAQIATVVSDETGSGPLAFATSPSFTTPNIGSATGSVSGNAGTATALQNPRTINGTSFDGTANITIPNGGFAVSAKTSDYTITTADNGTFFNNDGAAGEVIFTLPASPLTGQLQPFCVAENQYLRIKANTSQVIYAGGMVSASAGYMRSNIKGQCITISYPISGEWYTNSVVGTTDWFIDE